MKSQVKYGVDHYRPQAYLKGFANSKNQIIAFNKNTQEIFTPNIRNIFCEKGFFTLDGAQEASEFYNIKIDERCVDNELQKYEKGLGILKLIRSSYSFDQINGAQVSFLLEWVAWLMIASPDTKEILLKRNPWFTNTQVCCGFIDWTNKIKPAIFTKNWGLGVCDNDLLISSDRAVTTDRQLENPKDVVGLTNATILLALSPKILLIGTPNLQRFCKIMRPKRLSQNDAACFNSLLFNNAKEIIFAKDHTTLSSILSNLLDNTAIYTQ